MNALPLCVSLVPAGGIVQEQGRLRALGVSSAARSATLPEVPTISEAGVPFESTGWLGIFAPAGVPRDIVSQIQREMARAAFRPDMLERWPGWGYEPVGSTAEQFAAKFKEELATYARIIRDAGIALLEWRGAAGLSVPACRSARAPSAPRPFEAARR